METNTQPDGTKENIVKNDEVVVVAEKLHTTAAGDDTPRPGKIVIPDECGDTLWDDVLAQHP